MDRITYNKKIGDTVYVINSPATDKKDEDYIKKKVEKMIRRSIEIPIIQMPLNNKNKCSYYLIIIPFRVMYIHDQRRLL